MIEVRNLVKTYGDHMAVDHLNFTVEKGKIYGFLGPNGAGKSTTMNMMTGYLASTSGDIVIDGHDILKEPEEAKKCIGYLPEVPPLYMEMTPYEQLHFSAELKGIRKDEREERIVSVMKQTGIEDMADRMIRHLSKGYRQRVGLAQALLGDPKILILDEPTAGLDPLQIIEIRDLIRSLAGDHTVLLSSHILSEVSAVCDRVLIISHGKLVASDSPENLSQLMTGGKALKLTVKGTGDAVLKALKAVPKVAAVTPCREEALRDPKLVQVEVHSEDNQDVREAVFYALAEKRLPIYDMQSAARSLEEVFLELTENEAQDKEADA